jgi:tetratricopeptide (TPR) repeat protein
LAPQNGLFLNTLGVCYYRLGRWEEALPQLDKSNLFLGEEGIGFNAMFIAMSYWQLGNHDEANRQYDVAVKWMKDNDVKDDELVRFCQEAAETLKRDHGEMHEEMRNDLEEESKSTVED